MINFYRQFLPNCAGLMLPLTNMLSGPKSPLELTGDAMTAFERTKNSLVDAILLTHLAPEAQLSLTVDALTVAVGSVLQQHLAGSTRPLVFFSKKLLPADTRHSTFGREPHAIYVAVKHFRHFLVLFGMIVFANRWNHHMKSCSKYSRVPLITRRIFCGNKQDVVSIDRTKAAFSEELQETMLPGSQVNGYTSTDSRITRTNPPSNTTSPGEQTPVYLYQRQRKSSGLADEESSHYSVSRRFAAPGGAEKRLSVVFSGMNLDESDRKSSLPTSTSGRLLSPPPPGLVTRDGMGSQDLRVTDGRTRRHSHHSQTRQRRESGRQTASSVCTSPSDVPPSAGKDTVGNHRISSVTGNSATVTGDPQSLRRLFPEMSQKVKPLAPGRHERRYSQTKDEQRSLTNGSVTSCSNELKNIGVR
nr:unnamed protein product [Spirometra erinaceieuropaei]